MAKRKTYHLILDDKGKTPKWKLKLKDSKKAMRTYPTKKVALKEVPPVVRSQEPSQLVIYGQNGKPQEKRIYGNKKPRKK